MEDFKQVILDIIRSNKLDKEKKEELESYHESDIADVIPYLNKDERDTLFKILGKENLSQILPYSENVDEIFLDISPDKAADIVELMDSDDAVDTLQELDENDRTKILSLMEKEAQEAAKLILSYAEDEIGSKMTTNYILISQDDNIKQAMKKLISQAHENDNISTLFVEDENHKFAGAIDLKDLICARSDADLSSLIVDNYPCLNAKSKIDDCINDIREYAENTIPLINDQKEIVGVITANDVVEVVNEELSEDFHKFAAVTSASDLDEGVFKSISKRVPWLILLLFLGIIVSMIISSFDVVISSIPVMVFFQSLVLDMAGNTGTQSLAVTIRAISDEEITSKDKLNLVFREFKVGLLNGLFLGLISFTICLIYLCITQKVIINDLYNFNDTLLAAGIVGFSLFLAMTLASLVGTLIPLFFKKIHIDPAVASGPLITTVNDIVAVICYYGLTYILFNLF